MYKMSCGSDSYSDDCSSEISSLSCGSSINISDDVSYNSKFLGSLFVPDKIKFKKINRDKCRYKHNEHHNDYLYCDNDSNYNSEHNNNYNNSKHKSNYNNEHNKPLFNDEMHSNDKLRNNIYDNIENRINKNNNIDKNSNVISNTKKQISDTICVFEQLKYASQRYIYDSDIKNYMIELSILLRSRVASSIGKGAPLIRRISVDGNRNTHKHYISYKLKNNIWIRNKLIYEIDNIDVVNNKTTINFGNKKYELKNDDMKYFINDIEKNILTLNNGLLYLCSIKNIHNEY